MDSKKHEKAWIVETRRMFFRVLFELNTSSHYLISEIISDYCNLKRVVNLSRIGILNKAIKIIE